MDKKTIMLGMIFGSAIGGYIPSLFGASAFSMLSVICGALGGVLGIWLTYKILN